jgi:exopolysaccharide biosynthesis polyprenyl glycosylphosphotransferase
MLRQRTRTLQAIIALSDAVATAVGFFAAYYIAGPLLQQVAELRQVLPMKRYIWVLAVSLPMWWILFALFGAYDLSPLSRKRDDLFHLWRPLLVGALAISTITFFQKGEFISRRVVLAISTTNVFLILVGRTLVLWIGARLLRKQGGMRRIIIVGEGDNAHEFANTVRLAGWGLEVAGFIAEDPDGDMADCLGVLDDLPRILDDETIDDVVIVASNDFGAVQRTIGVCEEVGVTVHIPGSFFNATLSRPHLEPFFNIPMLTFTSRPYNPVLLGIKRAVDIIGALGFLAALSLPMLILAILVKASSKGPIFFRQKRAGFYGRPFFMYKFRSMIAGADLKKKELELHNEADGPAFKIEDDPRVTKLGRTLRKYSLDELPQLWNVLKGDMSLVGPRPPLPREIASYKRWQRRRLSMRPGLTCIWQVGERKHDDFESWMQDDLEYIDNWSLWLDFKLAIKTLPSVLRGTGV